MISFRVSFFPSTQSFLEWEHPTQGPHHDPKGGWWRGLGEPMSCGLWEAMLDGGQFGNNGGDTSIPSRCVLLSTQRFLGSQPILRNGMWRVFGSSSDKVYGS